MERRLYRRSDDYIFGIPHNSMSSFAEDDRASGNRMNMEDLTMMPKVALES